ncbi:hypothetical protein PSN45_005157 [Yamadazyma tenuis]|uniref:Maintenance of telomere capping protein 1 n=1 Tax=Candida tenuis (strain ATCC 10573 / BCRC 21748 / CBS 615 / JCM 9827 / NBRC 10315 / NRRL Y-1498 / VKM Y-70) TaxID=590646 RepID=G3B0U7_CANTC|nr:uncharacterized protein CANTEDRAFT_113579 [Yamadazyma tenuis ATCC 10573]EGV64806.1 hypothetical protein CANTEDRAFT_113579 [Yamadazyma tenuis ATCC 10573]WEJ97601.1 hypothetical protein PSN45_005157 [Yamadazyma tenuis]
MSKSTDDQDVLEFINSLPDSKSNTPKPEGKEEDLLDFLDELAAHDKKPSKLSPKKKEDPKQEQEQEQEQKPTKPSAAAIESANEELEIDPINSITNWWNKEGSTAVSSLWGSITTNATTLSETTYKIASDTTNQLNTKRQEFMKDQEENGGKNLQQITNLTNRLNNILSNITEQINTIGGEDELINLVIVNDLNNLTYLNDLISKNFGKVMNQVEGGIKVQINNYNHNHNQGDEVDLNMFTGKLIDGEKLCLANLDNSVKNFNKAIEFEKQEQTELNEKLNLINRSNVFISIQPINVSGEVNKDDDEIVIDQTNPSSFFFLIILNDVTNKIVIKTKTQAFPLVWASWLMGQQLDQFQEYEDIDPREWVKDWIKSGLNLSFGVLSQQYVIKRMGF